MMLPVGGGDSDDDNKREPLWPPLPEMGEDPLGKLMASHAEAEPQPQSPQLMEATNFGNWITPRETLLAITQHFEHEQTIKAILNRLSLGLIHGAAETTIWSTHEGEEQLPFIVMPKIIWRRPYTFDSKSDFWKTGDYTSYLPRKGYEFDSKSYIAYAGARFDPDGVIALAAALGIEPSWPKRLLGKEPWSGADEPAPMLPARPAPPKDNLSPAEAKRFCEFLLQGWPTISERAAHKRAVGFYEEFKVPRDWFWGIFRAIRGDKKPGKVAKMDP